MKKFKRKVLLPFLCVLSFSSLTIPLILTTSCSQEQKQPTPSEPPINPPTTQPPIQPPPPPTENKVLDPSGGNYNGLNVSQYKVIVEQLQLSNNQILHKLTNDLLNNKLHLNPDYSNLNLSIVEANEQTGTIRLKLSGDYYDQKNIDENIEISQFETLSNATFKINNLSIDLINRQLWFDNTCPINSGSEKDFNTWTSTNHDLINNRPLSIIINDKYNINDLFKNDYFKVLNFKLSYKNQKILISFSLEPRYQQYSNNQWTYISNITNNINLSPASNNEFDSLTMDDLFTYIIEKTTVNQGSEIFKYHPSYYYALIKYDNNNSGYGGALINELDVIELIRKYEESYQLKDKLNYVPQITTSTPNDLDGLLEYELSIYDSISQSFVGIKKQKRIENMQPLDYQLLVSQKQNHLQIKDKSNLYNLIGKTFKAHIEEINNSGGQKNVPIGGFVEYLKRNLSSLTNTNFEKFIKDNFFSINLLGVNVLIQNYGQNLPNHELNSFNLSTNLLIGNSEYSPFYIENIFLDYSSANVQISKELNGINLSIENVKITFDFFNNKQFTSNISLFTKFTMNH